MVSIITVPAFSDNYIWLICDKNKTKGIIVDPGDPRQLLKTLEEDSIQPIAILLTHLHFDHANGISKLKDKYPELPIYGPKTEIELLTNGAIPANYGPATNCANDITHPLEGNETLDFKEIGCCFEIMNLPGHTSGHIAYYDNVNNKLFCGDTLFAGGCGRVFNGTMNDLHHSLQKIAQLPKETLLYCAHEYTLDNLGFAKWVEPDNQALLQRIEADMGKIDRDEATVPSLLSTELATNPFLRVNQAHVIAKVEEATHKTLHNSAQVFAAMRNWKDTEYD